MDQVADRIASARPAQGRHSASAYPYRRAVLAAVVGNAFEFYDYFLYSTAAALIFAPLFFQLRIPSSEFSSRSRASPWDL